MFKGTVLAAITFVLVPLACAASESDEQCSAPGNGPAVYPRIPLDRLSKLWEVEHKAAELRAMGQRVFVFGGRLYYAEELDRGETNF